jgi:hypothetical protein
VPGLTPDLVPLDPALDSALLDPALDSALLDPALDLALLDPAPGLALLSRAPDSALPDPALDPAPPDPGAAVPAFGPVSALRASDTAPTAAPAAPAATPEAEPGRDEAARVAEARGDGTGGLSITNSGSGRRAGGDSTAGGAAFFTGPFGAICRSAGEKGNSSRPNRTTTHSSDRAGSPSATTWPTCPAIWPAACVNTTFGRRPAATASRIT